MRARYPQDVGNRLPELSDDGHVASMTECGLDGETLDLAVASLSPRQREALLLRYTHDLSAEEAAKIMKVEAVTVRAHCFKGLSRMRLMLSVPYTER